MDLPSFDVMVKMSTTELDDLFNTEAEEVIQSAEEEKQPRLRAFLNGCVLKNQAAKNPNASMVTAQKNMWESFHKLNDTLQDNKELFDGFRRNN